MDYQAPTSSNASPNSVLSSTSTSPTLETSSSPSKISWFMWIVIILVLAFFGFNVFSYLAKGTQGLSGFLGQFIEMVGTSIAKLLECISDFTKKIARILGFEIGAVIKTTTEVTATEAKAGIDEVSNTIVGAISLGQRQSTNVSSSLHQENPTQEQSSLQQTLNQSLNQQKQNQNQNQPQSDQDNYYADDSNSSIQSSKPSSKSGWCFIGEDRGFRSCIQVNQNDKCMSGDIFPSQEICINPNLRG